mmetsp:Transcript_3850/g.5140  ORF Transcript_3850/g.5140 Transcript_3850/m.5140 type:complete len:222 (+) Transcript_3850:607-1272(+)
MKKILVLIAIALSGTSFAQVGISAGGNMLAGFGAQRTWGGLHFGLEIPRDDAISIYGRLSHYFAQSSRDSIYASAIARDVTTNPYVITVGGVARMNYTTIEGGTRYYLGDGYDFGWAAYGGSNLMIIFNGARNRFQGYDELLYELDGGNTQRGTIFSLGFGLGGGLKYSVEDLGTFYFDLSLAYILLGQPSNDVALQVAQSGLYRPLLFTFNLGYRRDISW